MCKFDNITAAIIIKDAKFDNITSFITIQDAKFDNITSTITYQDDFFLNIENSYNPWHSRPIIIQKHRIKSTFHSLQCYYLIMNTKRKWSPTTTRKVKQQIKKIKSDSNRTIMNHLDPSIWNPLLSIHTNLLLIMTNTQLISSNENFSTHHIFITMHHNLPNISHSRTWNVTLFFNFKNDGKVLFLPSANLFQKTISGHHTRNSKQNIKISLKFSSNQTHILNIPQQNKTKKHSEELSEFIFSKIPPSPHLNYQRYMSNTLHTWIMTMALNFSLNLSWLWFPNYNDLEPKLKTLWYPFALVEYNFSVISTHSPYEQNWNWPILR